VSTHGTNPANGGLIPAGGEGPARPGAPTTGPDPTASSPAVTYSSYLALDELLGLQRPRSDGPEHDEVLFIVIHQVYELWFKEILHELDYLRRILAADDTPRAMHTLDRVLKIMKVLVSQIDVLETMTPLEFLTFRDRLESGSGFQSFQFRELEFVLGAKRRGAVEHYHEGSEGRRRLESRWAEPTLWDAFLRYLAGRGHAVPADQLGRDVTQPVEPSPAVQRLLVRIYRTDPMLTHVCERLVDLDEGIQEWRYRHVKMVQRTIGTKRGTGGSAGAEYLATTLSKPIFPDLWAIRSEL
jgi:tryptophan 2,3-dioxygenase